MNYNTIAVNNLNDLMREIAEYTRMAEEIMATLDSLKDTLKAPQAAVFSLCKAVQL